MLHKAEPPSLYYILIKRSLILTRAVPTCENRLCRALDVLDECNREVMIAFKPNELTTGAFKHP